MRIFLAGSAISLYDACVGYICMRLCVRANAFASSEICRARSRTAFESVCVCADVFIAFSLRSALACESLPRFSLKIDRHRQPECEREGAIRRSYGDNQLHIVMHELNVFMAFVIDRLICALACLAVRVNARLDLLLTGGDPGPSMWLNCIWNPDRLYVFI